MLIREGLEVVGNEKKMKMAREREQIHEGKEYAEIAEASYLFFYFSIMQSIFADQQ